MKSDEHLKLPGGSMAWWETAEEGRTLPVNRSRHTYTDMHSYPQTSTAGLSLLVPPLSLSPPLSKREWAGNKRGGKSMKNNTDSATSLTSFLGIPQLSRTENWNTFPSFSWKCKIHTKSSFLLKHGWWPEWEPSTTPLRTTKVMLSCLIPDTY